MVRRKLFRFVAATAVLMTVVAGTISAPGQSAGLGLKNIQLSSELSPIIKLNPEFASSVYDYTAVVDGTNVKSVKIVPIPASDHDIVAINGAEAGTDRPYRTELKPGDNKFVISTASKVGKLVQYTITVVQKDLSGQYKTEVVQKGIWRITDHFGFPPSQDVYLVEGASKAVLIDAAMGKGDLPGLARSLTSLPLEVAVTHGHGDHIGQLNQFAGSAIYMSEKDRGMLPKTVNTAHFKWVKDGDAIDLGGGRSLEVIEMPGHTEGSLLFLDRVAKTLAVGDAIGSGSYVWKFTGKSSLAEYRSALERLEARIAAVDELTFLTGHHWQENTPLTGAKGKQMVTDMKILCEKIIRGEIVGTPPSGFDIRGAKVLTASYGLAGIWYDPGNIQPLK